MRSVIEPDNQFTVRFYQLTVHASRGSLQVCGRMEEDFESRLRTAVENSITLDRRQKLSLAACLPWVQVPD
jgi:hypothetical protein